MCFCTCVKLWANRQAVLTTNVITDYSFVFIYSNQKKIQVCQIDCLGSGYSHQNSFIISFLKKTKGWKREVKMSGALKQ